MPSNEKCGVSNYHHSPDLNIKYRFPDMFIKIRRFFIVMQAAKPMEGKYFQWKNS